jgi:hypothetical protein
MRSRSVQSLRLHRGHLAAGLGAAAAGVGALFHHRVVAGDPFAVFGARVAEDGAGAAGVPVVRRHPQHEVGGGGAYLGAVDQQANVLGRRVWSAEFETVGGHLGTDGVTLGTVLDALLHVGGGMLHDNLSENVRFCSDGVEFPSGILGAKGGVFDRKWLTSDDFVLGLR